MPSSSITGLAQTLQPGIPVSGTLPTSDDHDYFAVTVQAGLNYALAITPEDSTVHLALVDSTGADSTHGVTALGYWSPLATGYPSPYTDTDIVASINTLYIPENATKLFYTFAAITTGTIFVEVDGSYSGVLYGFYSDGVFSSSPIPAVQYAIQLGAPDDYGDTPSTAGQLAIGGSVSGNFDVQNDVDEFAVNLQAGKTYEFDNTSGVELAMTLYGADQTRSLASWTPYFPALTYTPSETGTYYLSISTQVGTGLGQYTISAKLLDTPAAPSIQAAPPQAATASISIYRLFDAANGAQFLTADTNEFTTLLATRPDLISEGVSLQAVSSSDPNAAPVFRFFNLADGSHFFTASTSERDTLLATSSSLKSEGIAFYEYNTPQPNAVPVYRYFNTSNGTHLFTSSATEIAAIAATRPDLQSEGIAFFSPS